MGARSRRKTLVVSACDRSREPNRSPTHLAIAKDPHAQVPQPHPSQLEADLSALPDLPRSELQKRWVDLYQSPCPAQISRRILTRALAYRMQEQAFGGLDALTLRRLARAERDLAAGRPVAAPVPKIKPGTRLLREWNGKVHEVIVLERGVRYRDQSWPSLSAVAREITGTRWSGPRFFGLVKGATA